MTTPIQVVGLPIPQGSQGQATALQIKLKLYEVQQQRLQQQLKQQQAQVNRYKGNSKYKAQEAAAQRSLNTIQNSLNNITTQVNTTRNSYYQASGQYDKLLTGTNRDAFLALNTLFKTYGLSSLAGKIYDYVKNGYSSDTISILLQDTPEYKQRFAANDARVKAGLPVLSPADYINTENAYRQTLRQAGLPSGFYDSPSDFTDWIAKDVSPTEIKSRADLATQATALANPFYKQALNQMGIDDAHMAAYFLDPDKSLPLLQKAASTAAIGGEALQQGLTFNQSYAEQLATSGVTAAQAHQGFSQVAQELGTMQALGSTYGQQWNAQTGAEAVFGTSAAAAQEKAGLIGAEKGAFGGTAGGARSGLSQSKAPTSG